MFVPTHTTAHKTVAPCILNPKASNMITQSLYKAPATPIPTAASSAPIGTEPLIPAPVPPLPEELPLLPFPLPVF
jgi:hypothetical protein